MIDHRQHLFFGEKFIQFLLEGNALTVFTHAQFCFLIRELILPDICQFLVAESLEHRLRNGLHFRIRTEQGNQARQLSMVFLEIFLIVDFHANAFAFHHSVCARSPGFGVGNERRNIRRQHPHADEIIRPTSSERPPRFQMRIHQAERRQLIARPLVRALCVG